MKKLTLLLTLVLVFALVAPVSAEGPPPMPSGFWGYVTGIPVGTVMRAYVPDRVTPVAWGEVFMWEGSAVYSLDVPGDEDDTRKVEGGVEGGKITFRVGGKIVATGIWHSGTIVRLDLTRNGR